MATRSMLWGLLLFGGLTSWARAADEPGLVVATFGDQTIYAAEVERGVKLALKGAPVADEALPLVQAQILAQILERRIMLRYLTANNLAATEAEIDDSIAQIHEQLKERGVSYEQFLAEKFSTEADVREELAHKMGVKKLLLARVDDEAMRKYFDKHRQQFDGTVMRLSHILWRVEGADRAETQNRIMAQAEAVREEIVAGKLSFEEAAARYSAGPSRRQGGDVGLVPRHGKMIDTFTDAAFQLKPGEISPPVLTTFGVHLIKCVDARPGDRTWRQARRELQTACGNALVRQILDEELAKANVQFSGALPYIVPGTQKLVVPRRAMAGAGTGR